MKSDNRYAWFGSGHDAHGEACTACRANPGRPCTTAGTFGGRVAITGLHAERVEAARQRAARRAAS